MNRPALSAENFRAWYWLKTELQSYCRTQALRDLFKNPQGQTLAQALVMYAQSCEGRTVLIQRQFQFNQHIRDFFAQHPTATRAQALDAWQKKRETAQALVFPSHNE